MCTKHTTEVSIMTSLRFSNHCFDNDDVTLRWILQLPGVNIFSELIHKDFTEVSYAWISLSIGFQFYFRGRDQGPYSLPLA